MLGCAPGALCVDAARALPGPDAERGCASVVRAGLALDGELVPGLVAGLVDGAVAGAAGAYCEIPGSHP